jgi:ABC-2 type transport system permease protein
MENFPTSTPRPGPTPVATPPPAPLQKFFTAALKGVVSSQVEEALADPQVRIDPQPLEEVAGGPSHQPSLLDYLVPGYSLMFVFFLISNLAMSVLEERETGAFRRLLVAPVPLSRILLGKMFPYYLLAVVQFTLILIASKLIFAIDLGNSILGLGIIILASSLSIVTLGILITAFARSESQGNGLATVLVLAMAVVSGAMFPSISIPGLRLITPHYWAMQGFLNIIARGQSAHGALLPAGVLIIMSAIFFTIGALRFRFE